jgi:hypothetical protein
VFVRLENWTNDATNNLPISATKFDIEDNDFSAGLSLCLTRDGQGKPTTPLTWTQPLSVNLGADGTPISVGRTGGANNPSLQFQVADATGATINLTTAQALAIAIQNTTVIAISAGLAVLNGADNVVNAGSVNAGTVTVNCQNGNVEEVTLAASGLTINITNIATKANTVQTVALILIQDAIGGRTLPALQLNGVAATVRWDNGLTPVLTVTANKADIIQITAVNIAGVITLFGAQVIGAA